MRGCGVKLDGFGQVELGNNGDVRAIEDRGIFEWFVFAFGHGEQNEAQIFSEIVGRGTDEIADVFDEQEIERANVPIAQGVLNHRGFEVADRARGDLFHGSETSSQTRGIIFGREVANERSYPGAKPKRHERLFEEGGFAGARTRDEADDKNTSVRRNWIRRAWKERVPAGRDP